MRNVVILQRVIPHYRVRLFERLHQEFGWIVACADEPPRGTGLHVLRDRTAPFARFFPFKFLDAASPYCALVPIGRILSELRPEAIISEFSLQMSSSWQLAARRLLRRSPKVLFWSHGLNTELNIGSLHGLASKGLRKLLFSGVDGNIYYTSECRTSMGLGANSPGFVATNTIDVEEIRRTPSIPLETHLGSPTILSVGRITPDKALPLVVRGFLPLIETFPDATLVIIGDGPDRKHVEAAAGRYLGKNVVLTGSVFDEKVLASYFRRAQLSIIGGAAGLSVNHALAYDVPVLAFNAGPNGPFHHPEISYVKEGVTGWLVDGWSSERLTEVLRAIFANGSDPQVRLHKSLREYVDRELTLDRMIDGFRCVDSFLDAQLT
ncbi:glycosyltransferase family 4 protein [uncultured Bradyrhizobium sp.]|jgi:glycosyltransferase involved in cell wall biosynthesis|uniref:glycosyltransferase family 4 protein n=1 Tax=uncultured Bradyrhizobium sp. TaxID=199684 RepID=UPI002638CF17|nr:glycosyltransferase family 4 protein [uncultured Bradyrhizobium sp.]